MDIALDKRRIVCKHNPHIDYRRTLVGKSLKSP
jgi:hypothetical protein